jgi:hypothetical protein
MTRNKNDCPSKRSRAKKTAGDHLVGLLPPLVACYTPSYLIIPNGLSYLIWGGGRKHGSNAIKRDFRAQL